MKSIKKSELFNLLTFVNECVQLNSVPEPLHEDLLNFMYGQTVTKTDNRITFYPEDYNNWVEKLITRGLDYDIKVQ